MSLTLRNWAIGCYIREYEQNGADRAKYGARLLEQAEPKLSIRDPYVFEFLGLRPKEAVSESDLEDALLDKLQEFLLELGHGFCFRLGSRKPERGHGCEAY